MALTDFTIIRKSLCSRLFSTVTTILTVAVAVALMLTLVSMQGAGKRSFQRGAGNMHLLISGEASPLVAVLNSVFYARAPQASIDWKKFQELSDPALYPFFEFAIPTQLGDSYRGMPVMATTPDFFTQFKPAPNEDWELTAGRFFDRSFQVVIGAEAAKNSGLSVGDHVHLTHGASDHGHEHDGYEYEIVGILAPTGCAHDRALFTNLQSAWIVHAHDRRENAHGHGVSPTTADDLIDEDRKITGIYARVSTRPGRDSSPAVSVVFDQLRRDPSVTVASPSNQIARLFTIVGNIDIIFVGMAAVVMVSSGVAIMLALYNSMEQRRRQIAVLRVLGCSKGRIFGLVMTESALLGLLGAGFGIGLAALGSQIVALVLKQRVGIVIEPTLDLEATLLVTLGTILLATLAGLAPAIVGYRTPVARSLRPIG